MVRYPEVESPAHKHGQPNRFLRGGRTTFFRRSSDDEAPPRPVPTPADGMGNEDSLQRAVEPQHTQELEQAFERLLCLECLWLDMQEEAFVRRMIEEVPVQFEVFKEALKTVDREAINQLRADLWDLRQSRGQLTGGSQMVEPEVGPEEVQANAKTIMLQVIEMETFTFHYKHREHQGFAVHVLALHPQGENLLRDILESKANPSKACSSISKGRITQAEPLHIAAGGGNQAQAELLLQAKVDVNAKSWVDVPDEDAKDSETKIKHVFGLVVETVKKARYTGSSSPPGSGPRHEGAAANDPGMASVCSAQNCHPHYTPLHEATFLQQECMVKFLIYHHADVNAKNLSGDTSLHWSARQGNSNIARLLVNARADVTRKNKQAKTALEIAVESANFPGQRLGMLMQRQISEIMTVAKSAPNAAAELLRDHDECGIASSDWRPRLQDRVSVDQWVELMELAPKVAEDVLEVLTVTPEVENPDHWRLPRQATFAENEMIRCKYTKDDKWSYNATKMEGPAWHKVLIPNVESYKNRALRNMHRAVGFERKLVPVRVKMVRMPGLMNRQVLRALKDTCHLEIFTKLAAQAIIECAWHTVVKRFYYVHLVYRTIEIAILVTRIFLHNQAGLFREASWSWLLVCSSRELFYELCEIRGYVHMRQGYFVSAYLMDAKNMFDLTSILMLLFLSIQTWPNQQLEANLPLLAAVVASRWVQLVYTFRAFPAIGQKVLPIIQSFRPLFGIFFITVFIFTGFLHAFLVLNSEMQTEETVWEVFTNSFRFLFLADGDAVDYILGLGGRSSASGDHVTRFFFILAVIGFSILILNLFIAGAHQAYEEAHQNAETRFFQERADICLQCLFRPTFPWKCRRSRILAFLVLMAGLIPAWLALLLYLPGHPAVASALLFATTILGDSVLMQHTWRSKSNLQEVAPSDGGDGGSDTSGAEDTDALTSPVKGDLGLSSSTSSKSFGGWEQKYLWFCYRVECEDPGDGTGGEHHGHGSTLMGRKALEALRSQRQSLDLRRLRRDSERMEYNMDLKLSQIRDGMHSLSQDLGGRLATLEQGVSQLVAHMERLGFGPQAETALPEGWECAKAQNGRAYYYNRALRIRQWERPQGPPASTPAPTGSGRSNSSSSTLKLPGIRASTGGSRGGLRHASGESASSSVPGACAPGTPCAPIAEDDSGAVGPSCQFTSESEQQDAQAATGAATLSLPSSVQPSSGNTGVVEATGPGAATLSVPSSVQPSSGNTGAVEPTGPGAATLSLPSSVQPSSGNTGAVEPTGPGPGSGEPATEPSPAAVQAEAEVAGTPATSGFSCRQGSPPRQPPEPLEELS